MWVDACGEKSFLDKMEDRLRGVQDSSHKRILVGVVELRADWVLNSICS